MSPRNEGQNKIIREERREQILNSALAVFARKGLAATKMSDIAFAAGLSYGLVYHYFKSKDEIFTAVVEQTIETSNNAIRNLRQAPGSIFNKIKAMTEYSMNYSSSDESAFRWLIILQAASSDAVPEAVKEMIKKPSVPLQEMAALINEGQKNGEIAKGNPEKLATAYWAMMQGLALFRAEGLHDRQMPDAEMVLKVLRP